MTVFYLGMLAGLVSVAASGPEPDRADSAPITEAAPTVTGALKP